MKRDCKHEWTPIARAREPDGYDPDPPVWQWCIRCGRLKLEGLDGQGQGAAVFSPGPHQKGVIVSDKE